MSTIENPIEGTELVTKKVLEDTPFVIIKKDEEYFGICGKHRITEYFKTEEACEKDLKAITWNRITQVILATMEVIAESGLKVENELNNLNVVLDED